MVGDVKGKILEVWFLKRVGDSIEGVGVWMVVKVIVIIVSFFV